MALEEPQLNGRIASVIRPMTKGLGWTVREELWYALRGPKHKPDILITRDGAPPIILENEYLPANTLVADCTRVMGRELEPEVAGSTGIVGTVIAVRSSDDLNDCADGDQAQAMLERGATLEYAVYQGNMTTRFPAAGFITGSVREMVDFIKPAAEPRDIIAKAAKALARGANDAAQRILDCAPGTDVGELVGEVLRQPWPAVAERPAMTTQENRQQAADNTARRQTAKMCATIIINALAYQQNLAGYQGIRDLEIGLASRYIPAASSPRPRFWRSGGKSSPSTTGPSFTLPIKCLWLCRRARWSICSRGCTPPPRPFKGPCEPTMWPGKSFSR